ncbi:CBF/Mak21 family protein [Schizosaccharomyces cryophilus OY26]|uniref:CBF/Mak21 family protein n=1 Tax=Schizosaccharomyces cryophilus (strain OY26 / ATCC MYA-4695 / CBS 11777 / NBRC 106824 / NRRL Y48691) TaxID=653667 RepID=S9W4Z6_SCHCR|nr:CBF/Mak21 family protein [Schizosaccharomyces cryophilus OY26]EPY53604.1 CBF/Mak21 family protein [Schizosaccharomyces cryophilus OY26]
MIKTLENDIYKSKKNLNNVVELMNYMDHATHSLEEVNEAAAALCRVFSHFFETKELKRPAADDQSAGAMVQNWISDNFISFTEKLMQVYSEPDVDALQVSFLTIVLRLCKAESILDPNGFFRNQLYFRLCTALAAASHLSDLCVQDFVESYLTKYKDLLFYFYKNVAKIASAYTEEDLSDFSSSEIGTLASNILRILTLIPSPILPSSSWTSALSSNVENALSLKRVFQDAWLSALNLPLSIDLYKHVLSVIHKRVIPFLPKPAMLMDFLTDAYNSHHTVALLALNGLFTLIMEHNLDYPLFYPKLYALLDRNLLFLRTRSRFFRLLDLFLSSTHLPATVIASFIKKLARLALTGSPGSIAIVIPFIYNCLQRHPSCMQMLHRDATELNDPFDIQQPDPLLTSAIDSSLWELHTLQNHYHSNIASLAGIMSQQFTKPRYELEDFLDHNYATMCEAELRRPMKYEPPIEYEKCTLSSYLDDSWA